MTAVILSNPEATFGTLKCGHVALGRLRFASHTASDLEYVVVDAKELFYASCTDADLKTGSFPARLYFEQSCIPVSRYEPLQLSAGNPSHNSDMLSPGLTSREWFESGDALSAYWVQVELRPGCRTFLPPIDDQATVRSTSNVRTACRTLLSQKQLLPERLSLASSQKLSTDVQATCLLVPPDRILGGPLTQPAARRASYNCSSCAAAKFKASSSRSTSIQKPA